METVIWQSYPQDEVIVVGLINTSNQNQIDNFVEENSITFPIIFDPGSPGGVQGGDTYDLYYLPNNGSPYPRDFIVDREGILQYANNEIDTEWMIWFLDSLMESSQTMVEQQMEHSENWNLVGLLLNVDNPEVDHLFPDAIEGTLYFYDGTYQQEDDLIEGTGYWLRFDESGVNTVSGYEFNSITIDLTEGWNLISGTSFNSEIYDPEGIVIPGTIYGYDNAYYNATLLEPGKSYWVRAFESGIIEIMSR